MTTLAEVDRRTNEVIRMAEEARYRFGENSIPHRSCLAELDQLRNIRNQMLAQQPVYGQPYYAQPTVPRYVPQQPVAQQYSPTRPIATAVDSMGYSPVAYNGNTEVDNKFSSKADTIVYKPKVEITYPVGNSTKEEPKNTSKPIEGNEYELNVAHGLEAKREESNGSYKYEIYGSPLGTTAIKLGNLDTDVGKLTYAKKFSIEQEVDGMRLNCLKDMYGAKETDDDKSVNDNLKEETVVNAIVNLNGTTPAVADYLDNYYCKILNTFVRYGMKKSWEMERIIEDFDQLQVLLEKQPTKIRAYFNNVLNWINKDMNKNMQYTHNDKGTFRITHIEPCVYIDNVMFLGNIDKLVTGQCVRKDSNEPLFNMFNGIGSMFRKLITIDKVGVVTTYNVCLDIYGNYLISK